MSILIRTAILTLALLPQLVAAQETGATKEGECKGPYNNGEKLPKKTLQQVLERHQTWYRMYLGDLSNPKARIHPLRANLCGAILYRADLSGANLEYANLSKAILEYANLSKANLLGADLSGADLEEAILSGANLARADLSGADLYGANLSCTTTAGIPPTRRDDGTVRGRRCVTLFRADLSGADLAHADLSGAYYDPEAGKQPIIDAIATAKGLSTLQYRQPRALVKLRKEFVDAGYREQPREITYALRHSQTEKQLAREAVFGKLEGIFSYIFFEATTKWGMEPGRALLVMITLIPVFALPYIFALWAPKDDGIWRFWSGERAREDLGSDKPELLTARGLSGIGYAVYFSLLSAFHMGWKDLNVGNWIARIQPREYTLRASGWVRTVAGIQSLISVYLLAIWALTYFGRPFE